jgi:hypothetical protein
LRSAQGASFSDTELTDAALDRLVRTASASVELLNTTNCKLLSASSLRRMFELPCLDKLYVAGCDFAGNPFASCASANHAWPTVQALFMSKLPRLSDDAVACILRGCSNLQTLMLAGNPQLTDAALEPLPRSCTFLQLLDVADCTRLAGAPIQVRFVR